MKKTLILIMILALCSPVFGARLNKMQIQIVDEWGDPKDLTTSASGYIYDVTTVTEKTVYQDAAGNTTVVQPFTDDSETSIITDYLNGKITFWMKGGSYKLYLTDGTYVRTIDNLTGSDARVSWPTYLTEISSYTLGETSDLDFSYGAWIIDGDTAGRLDVIPDVADGILGIGASTGSQQGDVYTYASSTEFMYFDQSGAELNFTHIDVIVDDDSTLFFGDGKDISVKFDDSGDDLDITGDGSEIAIGASGAGLMVFWHGQTGNYVHFDENNDWVLFEDINIRVDSGSDVQFYHTDTVDWVQECATGDRLAFIPALSNDQAAFHIGDATYTGDLGLFGATASTVLFDASADEVLFDAYNIQVLDTSNLIIGTGDEWVIDNSSETLRIIGSDADDDFSVTIGVTTEGVDLKVWGATASTYMEWDASADELFLDLADLKLSDQSQVEFVDATDGVDWTVDCVTAETLLFTCAVTDETAKFLIGVDQAGSDFGLYGAAASAYLLWDASANALWVEGSDIFLGDSDLLVFGDAIGTGDIKIYATGTDLIIDGVQSETGTVAIGLTDVGLDFKLWAATNAEGVLWDASDEALEFTGANITLDAASILTLGQTVNADTVVTTGTYTVLVANSGKVHVIPDLAGATSINLPAEADGLYYKFIYVGAADEAHTHTIDSESDTNFFIGGVAFADTDAGDAADEINAGVYSDGDSNSKLALINVSAGTVVEVHCDGTNWYVTGIVFSATIPTMADQS